MILDSEYQIVRIWWYQIQIWFWNSASWTKSSRN